MAITIWQDAWDSLGESEWEKGTKSRRLGGGDRIGMSLYELPPDGRSTYHFHHASEEIVVALTEGVTLRTPAGERKLDKGEVVHFPRGPDGAHEQLNHTDGAVRYLVAGTRDLPEVAEYPDTRQITAQARTGSQTGEHLWLIHDLDPEQ
jgi:uncharacterized cupin superfamily protein